MAGFLGVTLAFFCTLGASGLALRHIYHHLCNYAQPIYQRYTVRIILMVPVSVSFYLFYNKQSFRANKQKLVTIKSSNLLYC